MAPIRNINPTIDGGRGDATEQLQPKKKFVPVKTITNQFGEKVQVDSKGLDSEGNLVIAAETPEDAKARATADRTETSRSYLGSGKNRMLVIKYSDGTEQQIPAPETGEEVSQIEQTLKEGRMLARDTFKKTLALMFGQEAMTAGWVDELYGTVSGYYKTGSDVNESLELSLRDVRNNPNLKQFTNRFRGIFALEDRLRKGEAVYVPSIAEYTGVQQKMGDVFKNAGLEDLATLDFTSDLISRNLSAVEIGNRINKVFVTIDESPEELKATFREYFPMVTRSDLARSLLLGEQGSRELEQKVAGIQVKSAAVQQGLVASDPFNLARSGVTYAQALKGYGEISQYMPTAQKLSAIQGGDFTMQEAEASTFGTAGSAAARQELETLGKRERAMFSGSSGAAPTALGGSAEAGML